MRRLISVGNRFKAYLPFEDMFNETIVVHNKLELPALTKDDVILFEGGEDVDPSMYNEQKHRFCGPTNLKRDQLEREIFEVGHAAGAKFIGICRGAQLLCALSGGKLIQDLDSHGKDHLISYNSILDKLFVDNTGKIKFLDNKKQGTCFVTSTHHQMMYPWNLKQSDFIVLGWSTINLSDNMHGYINNLEVGHVGTEAEVVLFIKTRALGIQFHPEFMNSATKGVQYARNVVRQFIELFDYQDSGKWKEEKVIKTNKIGALQWGGVEQPIPEMRHIERNHIVAPILNANRVELERNNLLNALMDNARINIIQEEDMGRDIIQHEPLF